MYVIYSGTEKLETASRIEYVKLQKNGKKVVSSADDYDFLHSLDSDKMYDKNIVYMDDVQMDAAAFLQFSQDARIAQSKADLEAYLLAHPLQWTDGEYYAITQEKQNQLTAKIMAATMAQTLSADYTLTWNSTGEVCREWTLQDLSALAFAIDARVTKLVSYQQAQEVAMRAAATLEELDAIEVDYDTVP